MEVAERFADGLVGQDELRAAWLTAAPTWATRGTYDAPRAAADAAAMAAAADAASQAQAVYELKGNLVGAGWAAQLVETASGSE